eukprot:COSAG01_NODE_11370_length_1950_cov_6.703944_1_plen_205_part_00
MAVVWLLGALILPICVFVTKSSPTGVFASALRRDHAGWAGYSGTLGAKSFIASFWILYCLTCSLILWPWFYTGAAAYSLSNSAINAVVRDLREADEQAKLAHISSIAQLQNVGSMVQIMHENTLRPVSQTWGPGVASFVFVCVTGSALGIPGLLNGDPGVIVLLGLCVVIGIGILLPGAFVTANAQVILSTLNDCRTLGETTGA